MPERECPGLAGEAAGAVAARSLLPAHLHPTGRCTGVCPESASAGLRPALPFISRSHPAAGSGPAFRRWPGGNGRLLHILRCAQDRLWGRNLAYHPHVHYLVPAGGLAADGKALRSSGQAWLAARQKFLLPVKALSRIFRAKMRQALQKIDGIGLIPPEVWRRSWVVHCKPVGCGQLALKYLAPYIFRVAISNKRILKLENEQVTFRYRATDTGQERLCTLAAEEFIRRFLQAVFFTAHVRPRASSRSVIIASSARVRACAWLRSASS